MSRMGDLAALRGSGVTESPSDLNSGLTIRIDADEVTRALDALDKKASQKAIKAAVRAGGRFLKPKMKAGAPEGKTKNLRKKVGSRVKKSKQHNGFYAAVRSFSRHHHLVVSGTKERFTKAGVSRGRMPANPYVDKVADQWEEAAIKVAEEELARHLGLE